MLMAKPGLVMLCCFVVSGSAGVVRAQEASFPGLGTRVRVESAPGSPRLVGTLTAVDQESLTVVPEGGREPRVVARFEIRRMEKSVRPSWKGRGALIGLGVGLAVTLGKVGMQGGCNDGCDASNVVVGALVALSAAGVGAIVSPGERWVEVAMGSEPSLRVVPQVGRGIGLTLVASF